MIRHIIIVLLLSAHVYPLALLSQGTHQIEWQRCLGGTRSDGFSTHTFAQGSTALVKCNDGGYIIAAGTMSIDGDIDRSRRYDDLFPLDSFRNQDIWLIKLSKEGVWEWDKYFGGDNTDDITCMSETFDGGYILCGMTASFTGDFSFDTTGVYKYLGSGGITDGFIMKIDSLGNKQWLKRFGGTGGDFINSIIQTSDSGYISIGSTYSKDEDWLGIPWPNKGAYTSDVYVTKYDTRGQIIWHRLYGGSATDVGNSILEIPGVGYIFCGTTNSTDGDVLNNHSENNDIWVVWIDYNGNIIQQRCYGGTLSDHGISIIPALGSGYLINGLTNSDDGDIRIGYHHATVPRPQRTTLLDAVLLHISYIGDVLWQRCYGGSPISGGSIDKFHSITAVGDSMYIFAGSTNSVDGDLNNCRMNVSSDSADIWAGAISRSGDILWQQCFGGSRDDYGCNILQIPNGYILTATVTSQNGNIIGHHGISRIESGDEDIWVAKLKTAQNAVEAGVGESHFANPYPNPSSQEMNLRIHPTLAPQSVKYFNLLGQEFTPTYKLDGNLLTANITSLPKGLYIIRITYPTGFQETRKFIVGE